MFPVDDPAVIFPQAYKWYGADQGLKCKGDGETALRRLADVSDPALKLLMEQAGQSAEDLVEVPCPCPLLESGKCGPKGCLLVMLPRVNCGGIYQIDTGSYQNIVEINSTLVFLQGPPGQGLLGRVSMVPLKLRRVPQEIQFVDPQTGKATKKTHYLLKLIFEGDLGHVAQLRAGQLSLPAYTVPDPVESGPEPTGECPIEIEGEVVDPLTGEVISESKAAPTSHPSPAGNGKAQGGNWKSQNEKDQEALEARLREAGIPQGNFEQFLAECNPPRLTPGEDGEIHLDRMAPGLRRNLLAHWDNALAAYQEWKPRADLADLLGALDETGLFLSFISQEPTFLQIRDDRSLHAEDIPLEKVRWILEHWASVCARYEDWKLEKKPSSGLILGGVQEVQEVQEVQTSASKLSKAEALAPRVTRGTDGVFLVPSGSQEGTTYQVISDEGGWACNCEGWAYRGPVDPGYQCCHIMAARMAAPAMAEK